MAACVPNIDIGRDYTETRLISSGSYGKIVEVRVNKDFDNGKYKFNEGMVLAMKIDQSSGGIGPIVEIDILNRVNHPNVINSYDTFSRSSDGQCININLVIPLATYSLTTYIANESPDAETVLDIMYQLLCGLYYLHNNYIIHDDLKPDNILVYEDEIPGRLVVKITDFGISGIVTKPEGIKKVSQSLYYRPYEILYENVADDEEFVMHSYEADIWSMGVIFYELITGVNPFKLEFTDSSPTSPLKSPVIAIPPIAREGDDDILERITIKSIDMFMRDNKLKSDPRFQGQLAGSADLIARMLDPNPKTRPSAGDLLNDPIFTGKACPRKQIETIECGTESYLSDKHRQILFDWMNEVRSKFRFGYDVLFLAYDIVDRYFAVLTRLGPSYHIKGSRYQLVSIVAMYMAEKMLLGMTSAIDDYIWISAKAYNTKEFVKMMCDVLEKLGWVVFRPTLYMKHPEIDPEKLVQCYRETTTPTLEMCQRIELRL